MSAYAFPMTIISYLEQLKQRCEVHGITLYNVFKASRINPSTYSRTVRNLTGLHYKTAQKLDASIDRLALASKRREKERPHKKLWGLPDEH